MLVLTRKLNEQIKIGDNITITVIKLRNNQIRLGIEAPREVRVLRGELETSIQADAAAKSTSSSTAPASSTNRVRTFLSTTAQADRSGSSNSHQPTRNDVVDGLMSAAEMIAAGKEMQSNGDHTNEHDDENLAGHEHDAADKPVLQIFSGKIDCDGTLRETTPGRAVAPRNRAPLAGYFTAP